MSIYLGNLPVGQIEKRLGIEFPYDIVSLLEETHQDNAGPVMPGRWHCFDIPFVMVFGDSELATTVFNSVKGRSGDVKEALQLAIQSGGAK